MQGVLVNNNFQLPSIVEDDFFVWSLMRLNVSRNDTDDPTIPTSAMSWNEFNEILEHEVNIPTKIR